MSGNRNPMSNMPQINPYNVIASSSFQPNPGVYVPPVNYPPPNMMHHMPPPMHGGMMPPPGYPPMGYPGYNPYHVPPPQPPQNNYSFLDPIIPTEKMESPFQQLLKPQKEKIFDVYKKLYVGKIPADIQGNL